VCANDVICPATVSPQIQPVGNPLPLACDRDAVVDCDSSMRNPSMLLDCTLYGETCSSDGITTCTVSASGPAAPEWLAVPAGHFTPVLGLIAGMPTDVAAFEMLRTEVTLGQYDACVRAGACSGSFGCEPQSDRGDVPLDCATEPTAEQYCAWLGGRLPTAAEWEYAARNAGEDVTFPWGDDPITCSDVGSPSFGDGSKDCIGAATVGCRHARDVTAQGICDLVGNLAEWVARVDSNGASERGSSFGSWSPATLGGGDSLNTAGGEDTLGFRCVR
jgi:iron(II)-dependent oxidoreductase